MLMNHNLTRYNLKHSDSLNTTIVNYNIVHKIIYHTTNYNINQTQWVKEANNQQEQGRLPSAAEPKGPALVGLTLRTPMMHLL